MNLETIIGLEIHVQLKTASKMFCSCPNVDPESEPNSAVCPICLGHPGVLPVVNQPAVADGVKAALALNMQVNQFSKFDRKSYFYPDLPKGFQISQYDQPLAVNGYLEFFVGQETKKITLERLHLEEDTAKNIHQANSSLIDFNRSGTPLLEIVTEPVITSPAEAKFFLQELRLLMRYLGVSAADMEKGQLRCDANISLRPAGELHYMAKTEIKNLNSFRSVEKALQYEVQRQSELWRQGKPPASQSTRGWDEQKQVTVEQRTKEEASDYRYFPEPDIPPLQLKNEFVEKLRLDLPELPQAKRNRFLEQYAFKLADINIIVQDKYLSEYVEQVVSEFLAWLETAAEVSGTTEEIWQQHQKKICQLVSGWLLSKLFKLVNERQIDFKQQPITAENFAEFLALIFQRRINSTAAQIILEEMFDTGQDPSDIMDEKDLSQSQQSGDLHDWVEAVVRDNTFPVEQYQGGKENVLQFLIGLVMKKSAGKADPTEVKKALKKRLG